MNIKQAKEELIHTVKVYTSKDEYGFYRIPSIRQRPLLLIGPPGIGKTAVMEQVARECGIGLVSYTMTHHTRQSAVGLPLVKTKKYAGQEYSITEYTMSEIIASLYEWTEMTGQKEGILFLDEINCVSETLAPTMLQFLQCKTFGSHRVPEGWMIAAAGNPPEYNKSVREFDIVTLDRVRRMNIEPDVEVWLEYAQQARIHSAVLAYLQMKPGNFYYISKTLDGLEFVTARGWEDLSVLLKEYEEWNIPVTEEMIEEYIQTKKIAGDFYAFYQMCQTIGKEIKIKQILEGREDYRAESVQVLEDAPVDRRFCVAQWILSEVQGCLWRVYFLGEEKNRMEKTLQGLTAFWKYDWREKENPAGLLDAFADRERHSLEVRRDAGALKEEQIHEEEKKLWLIHSWKCLCMDKNLPLFEQGEREIRNLIHKKEEEIYESEKYAESAIYHAARFLEEVFGQGPELQLFLSGILGCVPGEDFLKKKTPDYLKKYEDFILISREEQRLRRLLEE